MRLTRAFNRLLNDFNHEGRVIVKLVLWLLAVTVAPGKCEWIVLLSPLKERVSGPGTWIVRDEPGVEFLSELTI